MASRLPRNRRGTQRPKGIAAVLKNLPKPLVWGWTIWMIAVIATLLVMFAPPLDAVKQTAIALITSDSQSEDDRSDGTQATVIAVNEKSASAQNPAIRAADSEPINPEQVETAARPLTPDSLDDTRQPQQKESQIPEGTDTAASENARHPQQKESQIPEGTDTAASEDARQPQQKESQIPEGTETAALIESEPLPETVKTTSLPLKSDSRTDRGPEHTTQPEAEQKTDQSPPGVSSDPSTEERPDPASHKTMTSRTLDSERLASPKMETGDDPNAPSTKTEAETNKNEEPLPAVNELVTNGAHQTAITWDTFVFSGKDDTGRKVRMELLVLSADYFWRFSDLVIVDKNNRPLALKSHLASNPMRNALKLSQGVICIGTASEEGSLRIEETRAALRADRLVHWLIDTRPEITTIYALGLGQYQKHAAAGVEDIASEEQRRVILINIIHQDNDADLTQALRNGLDRLDPLPFELQRFSAFDLKDRTSLI